jgi:hypothetical protein
MLQRQDDGAGAQPASAEPVAPVPGGAPAPAAATATSGACPSVPTSTPSTCTDRHNAYAAARKCFPLNAWLPCVDRASADVCRAIDAFNFNGTDGKLLRVCVAADPNGDPTMTRAKAAWFDITNSCIWGHWRAALEAVHDPTAPMPGTLTPEWADAVKICRRDGAGAGTCCHAHVVAEQNAIEHCSSYDSSLFGKLPTYVPYSTTCSAAVMMSTPPPAFTGDFSKVSDRISYGDLRCCTF